MVRNSILCFLLLAAVARGSELGLVVKSLEEPSVENARAVIADLDRMISGGDARTVTLAKKMSRSVRRIFSSEYKIQQAKKLANQKEIEAKQLDRNGRKWLTPNSQGQIHRSAAEAAFGEAREIRLKLGWEREALSKEWKEEVEDFERMLGDLEFSQEWEALCTLSTTLSSLVQRTPWVDRPEVSFQGERLEYARERLANHERWLLLAKHASDASDFELSYHFHRLAGDSLGRKRVGRQLAAQLVAAGFPGSAINVWRRLGDEKEEKLLLDRHPDPSSNDYIDLDPPALRRNVAPSCVRILTPDGYQTGFYIEQGGVILTCKSGLKEKEETKEDEKKKEDKATDNKEEPFVLRIVHEDGRIFVAELLSEARIDDLALLKVSCEEHELLSLGKQDDLKRGDQVTVFTFPEAGENTPRQVREKISATGEKWKNQPVFRLPSGGAAVTPGSPVVDQKGRVLGVALETQGGQIRVLEIEGVLDFLRNL